MLEAAAVLGEAVGVAGQGLAGEGTCPCRVPTELRAQPGTGSAHVTLEGKPVPSSAHQEEKEIPSSDFFFPPAYFFLAFP